MKVDTRRVWGPQHAGQSGTQPEYSSPIRNHLLRWWQTGYQGGAGTEVYLVQPHILGLLRQEAWGVARRGQGGSQQAGRQADTLVCGLLPSGPDNEQVQGTWGDKMLFPKPRTSSSHPPLDRSGFELWLHCCFFFNWSIVVYNVIIIFAVQQSDSVLYVYSRLPRWH